MKVKVVTKEGKNFSIYVPMTLARIGVRVGLWGAKKSKNIDKDAREYLNIIDEKVIATALRDLSRDYKGLDLVDISSKDGEIIKITV